jgi:hypothetical protein
MFPTPGRFARSFGRGRWRRACGCGLAYNRPVKSSDEPIPSGPVPVYAADEDEVLRASRAVLLGSALGIALALLARRAASSPRA